MSEPKPLIVFQTAFDQYALEAFEHEAVDYLVKPVTLPKLQRAIERCKSRLAHPEAGGISEDALERLQLVFEQEQPTQRRILVREGDGHRLVAHEDILWFYANDGAVWAHQIAEDQIVDYTLSDLEKRMGKGFLRTSRSELVNASFVQRITSDGDGSATLHMTNGASIHVSRRRAAGVKEQLSR